MTTTIPAGRMTVADPRPGKGSITLTPVLRDMRLVVELEGMWLESTSFDALRLRVAAALEELEDKRLIASATPGGELIAVGDGTVLIDEAGDWYDYRGRHGSGGARALLSNARADKLTKQVWGLRRVTPSQASEYRAAVHRAKDTREEAVAFQTSGKVAVVRPVLEQCEDGRIAIFYGDRSLPVMLELGMDGEEFVLDGQRGPDIAVLARRAKIAKHPQRGVQVLVIEGGQRTVVDAAEHAVSQSSHRQSYWLDFDADEYDRLCAVASKARKERESMWQAYPGVRLV